MYCKVGCLRVDVSMCIQLGLTLCDSMDCSLPGFSVHGIFRVRIVEWLPFPPLGNLPGSRIEPVSPVSPALQVDSLLFKTSRKSPRLRVALGK